MMIISIREGIFGYMEYVKSPGKLLLMVTTLIELVISSLNFRRCEGEKSPPDEAVERDNRGADHDGCFEQRRESSLRRWRAIEFV
jgi:hypothetical protein